MSESETTPRKQTSLEWNFKKDADRDTKERAEEGAEKEAETPSAEDGAEKGTEQWADCTQPFNKLGSLSSPDKWKAFTQELEVARLRRIADAEERG